LHSIIDCLSEKDRHFVTAPIGKKSMQSFRRNAEHMAPAIMPLTEMTAKR